MREKENERKSRKRGMLISFFFHSLLIALGLIPFLTAGGEKQPEPLQAAIMVDFTDFKSSAASRSPRKTQIRKAEKPKPKPVPEIPEPPRPLETAPDEESVLPTSEIETPRPEPLPEVPPIEETAPVETPEAPAAEAGGESEENPGQGDGDSEEDKSPLGDGVAIDENAGDGIFNRRVIERANIKDIIDRPGKLVVNLCINPAGRVTFAEIDQDRSTLRDRALLQRTEEVARAYRFERDYGAPYRQCGRLTFIIRK